MNILKDMQGKKNRKNEKGIGYEIMIINEQGAAFLYEGIIYHIGDKIIGTEESEFAGLNGVIVEIRDGEDKEMKNNTPEIYCSFVPPVIPQDIIGFEKRFSELYHQKKRLNDICLNNVIMSPKMIMVKHQKNIKVYVLKEDWATDSGPGRSTRLCASMLEAKALLNGTLGEEISNGCISDWIEKANYKTEVSELSYEGWIEGHFSKAHYIISVEELELGLTPNIIGDISRIYMENCRYDDFASQVAQWNEAGQLDGQEYQRFLADKRIPEMIGKYLGDFYWESYWQAVSEAAHTLFLEHLDKAAHSKIENKERLYV